jgi:transcription initiation factor TFIIIB Brf1 subunit/transcription initiation factor TFIIB
MSLDDELFELFGNEKVVGEFLDILDDKLPFENSCTHKEYIEENCLKICKNCGLETTIVDHSAEWRNYGDSSNDTSRCHQGKKNTKGNIDKVFQSCSLDLSLYIKRRTEEKYKEIVGDDTIRGEGRKALVAVCLLHVYKENGHNYSIKDMAGYFGLKKNKIPDALSKYYKVFPKDKKLYNTPEKLIYGIMILTEIDLKHYQKILRLCNLLKNTSKQIIRSNARSVAAAIVYLYICLNNKLLQQLKLTKSSFAEKARLSDITISKLVKEFLSKIILIMNSPDSD